ncbi:MULTISPECIES: M23 family metallopeptidase [unclassified Microbacterium]|uniref:M23 family metallopeptidase n=1 Tax=unclassified Microbacterium TaxID=2609290 RepID=UPI003018D24A
MPAPVAAAAVALGNTRTGRKIFAIVLIVVLALGAVIATPVWVIPLAVAGQSIHVGQPASAAGGVPVTNGEWGYPLEGEWTVGRGFGWHPVEDCAYCPSDHLGFDMSSVAMPCGAVVHAASAGRVINAGPMPGWGNTVRIDHGGGLVTLYGHMQWNSLLVTVGQDVDIGTSLGAEGSTGKSTGCHLHYEIQRNGVAIDPEPFMAALGLPLQ